MIDHTGTKKYVDEAEEIEKRYENGEINSREYGLLMREIHWSSLGS